MAARRRRIDDDDERLDRGSAPDLFDVPAAVICVHCGDTDCPGCEGAREERSGIVSIVPWERPGVAMFSRLWWTARATTLDAESFFETLPDGPLTPALRFAAFAELLASAAAFVAILAIVALVAPAWLAHLALDPIARSMALRGLVFGLPAFAGMLVAAHVAHALSIDFGAGRHGARRDRTRALRFGLYACGWDLVMGPIGAVVVAIKEGVRAAFGLGSSLSGLPTRATLAFLRGCYRLEGDRARGALTTSYVGASAATLLFAIVVLVGVVALVLA